MGIIRGLLRIHVIEAKGLLNKDDGPVEMDVSDPYVTVDVGMERVAKTSVKNNSLNPRWNEVFSVEVDGKARSITLKVKDSDYVGSEMLGWLAVDVEDLIAEQVIAGWFPLICPQGRDDCGKLRLEMCFTAVNKNMQRNLFPLRTVTRMCLYGGCFNKVTESALKKMKGKSWGNDLMRDLQHARKFIYINVHSFNPDTKLVEDAKTLGTILKEKSDEGVCVLLHVQDECWGSPCKYECHMMDPDRNVKLRFMSSSVQVTSSNSSRDSHPGSGYVVVDTGSGDMRRLTAYFGGMKMDNNPGDSSSSSDHCTICGHGEDIIPSMAEKLVRDESPDAAARFQGRLVHDLLLHFEEEWLREEPATELVEIDEEDFDLENCPVSDESNGDVKEERGEVTWECTLLKTMPEHHHSPISTLMSTFGGHHPTTTTEEYLVTHIQAAREFVYVECPKMMTSSDHHHHSGGDHITPVLREVIARITRSVESGEDFLVIMVTAENSVSDATTSSCLGTSHESDQTSNRECVKKMYSLIGGCISKRDSTAHPTEYLQVYTGGDSSSRHRVHVGDDTKKETTASSVIIIDDQHLVIGPLDSSPDNDLSLALCQPQTNQKYSSLSQSEIARFRSSLWSNQIGCEIEECWGEPGSEGCRGYLLSVAHRNREQGLGGWREFCKTVRQNGDVEFYNKGHC